MIQDIDPHELHIGYEYHRSATETDCAVLIQDGKILLDEENHVPTFLQLGISPENATYLFMMDETAYYLIENAVADDHFHFEQPGTFRTVEPRHMGFAGITAVQLANFYHRNRFCSTCGAPLSPHESERVLYCKVCGRTVYPRISPAVIVAVTDGDYIVLTRYAGRAFKRYALVAGYCEVGETPEDTVRREVLEETGLHVKSMRYYKSQPWSFSETLLLGFVATADHLEQIKMDENELSYAMWVHRKDIPDYMGEASLTREMILAFRDGTL